MDLTDVFSTNYMDLLTSISQKQDSAFYVCDLNTVIQQHKSWSINLGFISPYFAVKSNPDPLVIKILYGLGCGFDCASKVEIDLVLSLGVPASKILFANPCKIKSHIKHAQKFGIPMTVDNIHELRKISSIYPKAKIIVRIKTDDHDSLIQLSTKFGADLNDLDELLSFISQSELEFLGFSFHVGSGCTNPKVFNLALKDSKMAIAIASDHGLKTQMIDIGGGYPGEPGSELFNSIAEEVKNSINELEFGDVMFVSEPGKFFVQAAFYLALNVHSMRKKLIQSDQGDLVTYMYYVDDGLYGSFNIRNIDGIKPIPRILSKSGLDDNEIFKSSLWGPTCDSIDCLQQTILLPKLNIGDWIYYDYFGDYTISSATSFNGMDRPMVYYTFSD